MRTVGLIGTNKHVRKQLDCDAFVTAPTFEDHHISLARCQVIFVELEPVDISPGVFNTVPRQRVQEFVDDVIHHMSRESHEYQILVLQCLLSPGTTQQVANTLANAGISPQLVYSPWLGEYGPAVAGIPYWKHTPVWSLAAEQAAHNLISLYKWDLKLRIPISRHDYSTDTEKLMSSEYRDAVLKGARRSKSVK